MSDTKSNLPRCRGWRESGRGGTGSPSSPSSPSTSHIYWLIIEGSLETSPLRPRQDRWEHCDGWGWSQGTDFLTGLQPWRRHTAGEAASWLLPWPQGSDPGPRSCFCHPLLMILGQILSSPGPGFQASGFYYQGMREVFWDLGRSGLLPYCVALGGSLCL